MHFKSAKEEIVLEQSGAGNVDAEFENLLFLQPFFPLIPFGSKYVYPKSLRIASNCW